MKRDPEKNTAAKDADIIEMLYERDERGLDEMERKFSGFLNYLSFNVLRDRRDAEECVNDVYSAAWNNIPPERPERLGSYLARLTRNLSLKRLREKTAEKRGGGSGEIPLDELDDCIPGSSDVEDSLDAAELASVINAFLSSLSRDERVIFVRRYWYLDRVADIAYRTGFTESKVKMSLSRTREKLRLKLVEKGIMI
ncbi:MAG: sigma-70 family RNA polymerase sigma factor [Clostridia bacterium]|nr:sigma-70 family RNA polymerase sigma factor [Clostridia bacterium]